MIGWLIIIPLVKGLAISTTASDDPVLGIDRDVIEFLEPLFCFELFLIIAPDEMILESDFFELVKEVFGEDFDEIGWIGWLWIGWLWMTGVNDGFVTAGSGV